MESSNLPLVKHVFFDTKMMCVFSPKSLVDPFSFIRAQHGLPYLSHEYLCTYLLTFSSMQTNMPPCLYNWSFVPLEVPVSSSNFHLCFRLPSVHGFTVHWRNRSGCRTCCTCTPTGLLLLQSSQMHRRWHGANRNMVAIHPMFKMSSGYCSRVFSMLQIVKDCLFELCSLIWLRLTENMWVKSIALYISLIYFLGQAACQNTQERPPLLVFPRR